MIMGHRTYRDKLPVGLRLGVALLVVVAIALMPRRLDWVYVLPATLLITAWFALRVPAGYVLRRLLVAEVFIVGLVLLSLFSPGSRPVVLSAVLKSNLCVLTMVLLTWTTPFERLLMELRRWRLPGALITTMALMYRYVPVLADETKRMERARASRSFSRRHRLAWRSAGEILGRLFIRSVERAESIYLAMCARGWK
jgi:cobalt/nickel transport system permease protein